MKKLIAAVVVLGAVALGGCQTPGPYTATRGRDVRYTLPSQP